MLRSISGLLVVLLLTAVPHPEGNAMSAERPADVPRKTATLGGGCFWCLEAVFEELDGVQEVVSGYAGGELESPTYRQVCTGLTGHAEVVQIHYDPTRISFPDLLTVFFGIHDPTTLNRQGADEGTQYRSIVLYHDEEQKRQAELGVAALEEAGVWDDPIVTEIVPFDRFYPAEDYHQDYYANNEANGYCQAVISPKLEKFRQVFADRLKD